MDHRRQPGKLWRDSHTSQRLRVQIVLGAGRPLPVGSIIWPPWGWGSGVVGVTFSLAGLLFALKAWGKDAVASPGLLLALGVGFAAGLVARLGSSGCTGEWGSP